MSIYLYIFGSVILVSLISLIGISFMAFSKKKLKKITMFLVAFSAGTLLGNSFFHLLPEALHEAEAHHGHGEMNIWIYLVLGIIIFFILEKIIHWRHCHIPTCDEHPHHLGKMNLIGDFFHNFFDGAIIAGAFLVNIPLGIATLIAVIAHEVPQEIADFGVLLYSGYSKKRALFLNFITALSAVLGAVVVVLVGTYMEHFSEFIVPFTAGGFIYIATADLIPELNKEISWKKSLLQLLTIVFGLGLMLALMMYFSHSH